MAEGASSTHHAVCFRSRASEVLSPIFPLTAVLLPAAFLQRGLAGSPHPGILYCFLAAVLGALVLSLVVQRSPTHAGPILFAYLLAAGANLVALLVGSEQADVAPLRLVWLFLFAASASVLPQLFNALRSADRGPAAMGGRAAEAGVLVWNGRFATIAAVGALVIASFALRYWQLTANGVYFDEHKQLDAVVSLRETGSLDYRRAAVLSHLASFVSAIASPASYDAYLHSVRVIPVFFGSITVVPLYFYARSISRPVGLLACALWTFSPWTIGVGRYFREYSAYCFLITLVLAGLHCGLPLIRRRGSKSRWAALLFLVFLVSVLCYAAFDNSTLKFSFVACGVTLVTLALPHSGRALRVMRARPGTSILALAILGIATVSAAVFIELPYFSVDEVTPRWAYIFLDPNAHTPIHWWGGERNDPLAVYFLLVAGLLLYRLNDPSSAHLVVFSQFALYVAGYVLFFDRYVVPRYVYYVAPVFVTLIASSCWRLLRSLDVVTPRLVRNTTRLLMAAALIAFFDIRNGLRVVDSPVVDAHGLRGLHFVATGEDHYLMGGLLTFFRQLERAELRTHAFVGTLASPAMKIEFGVRNWFQYDFHEDERFGRVLEFVKQHPDGWIVIDDLRNGRRGFPDRPDFRFGPRTMRLVYDLDGFKVYRWTRTRPADRAIPVFRPRLHFGESD